MWEKKNKGTTKCDKKTITCVGITQCENRIVKYEKKKIKEPSNVTKELPHVMLELHNMRKK